MLDNFILDLALSILGILPDSIQIEVHFLIEKKQQHLVEDPSLKQCREINTQAKTCIIMEEIKTR